MVFIDWQNAYNRARDCFHDANDPSPCGQVDPLQLGQWLAHRRPNCELKQVRVYRGLPTNKMDPKGYGINRRQAAAWRKVEPARVEIYLRPLQYLPGKEPREKGIDVALAIDFVMMATRDEYDIGVLVSADTDLKPALDAVYDFKGAAKPWPMVMGWHGPYDQRRITGSGIRKVPCIWLEQTPYETCRDHTDYGIPK
ncbi:MAG: NYN domain-containing protein [Actinomycetes bacterium]